MEFLHELLSFVRHWLDPEHLIAYGGLSLLFAIVFAETGLMIGFFLPGDSLLFTAGLLCATGTFETSIFLLLGTLTLAAVTGDQTGYWLGKKMGGRLFTKEKSLLFKPAYVERTREFYAKYGGKTIILGRFVPIVRTFAPLVAGVAHFPYRTFIVYNLVGGIVWVSSMTLAGYWLGIVFPQIKSYLEYIIVAIILVSLIPVVRTYLKNGRKNKNHMSIAENLQRIRADVTAHAQRVGRKPEDIQLIAVSKTKPIELIREVRAAGQLVFGENRVQELASKQAALPNVEWHLVGSLQTNKTKYIASFVRMIHSVNSVKLLLEIERQAIRVNRSSISCLVQLDISHEENKKGATREDCEKILEAASQCPHVSIRGMMGIAALTEDKEVIRKQFRTLKETRDEFQSIFPALQLEHLSMGMSDDYPIAIEEGATMIRIGSAIFGGR